MEFWFGNEAIFFSTGRVYLTWAPEGGVKGHPNHPHFPRASKYIISGVAERDPLDVTFGDDGRENGYNLRGQSQWL